MNAKVWLIMFVSTIVIAVLGSVLESRGLLSFYSAQGEQGDGDIRL